MLRSSVALVFLLLVGTSTAFSQPASSGFIYGTVTERSGESHTGFLRWGVEEAFWDDVFDSRQVTTTWREYIDFKALHKEEEQAYFESHGMLDRIAYALHNKKPDDEISRLFTLRFGDLESIAINEDDDIKLTLHNGQTYDVAGYANDVSSDILVYSDTEEPEELEWDDLATIRFAQAPAEAKPYAERLYGKVKSSRGDFAGFIMWDMSECVSTDILDSDQEDVPMGTIRSISRTKEGNSEVTFKDGRIAVLSGSNDVDNDNRGVSIETENVGRPTIAWKRIKSVEFVEGMGSGRSLDQYRTNPFLKGTVVDTDGNSHSGRLIYDLDEAYTHDIFSGESRDVLYEIPFELIATIEPLKGNSARLTLRDGTELKLQDDQDTGDENGGVLIFNAAETTTQRVPWSRIAKIQLTF